jgi:hypothetical protein
MPGLADITGSINTAKSLSTADPSTLGKFSKGLQAGVQNFCKAYGNNQAVFNLSFVGPAADEICAPYFSQQGLPAPSSKPPYTGGQCAVQYLVKTSGQRKDGLSPWTDVEVAVIGPLGEIAFSKPGDGFGVFIRNGAGNLQAISPYTTPFNEVILTAGPTVRRPNNAPDTCGDPPPVFKPSGGPTYNFGDNVSVTNNDGSVTNVSVGAPSVSLNGELNIPVNVGGVSVNLGGGSPEVGPAATKPTQAKPPIDGGDNDENGGDFPPEDGTFEYIGAIVEILSTPAGEGSIVGTFPNTIYPRTVGNARLKLAVGGQDFLPVNHQIREDILTLIRPEEGIKVKGCIVQFPEPGFTYQVTPLTKPIDPEQV